MTPAGHWFDEGLRQIGATVIPMGTGNTDLQVQVLQDMEVTGWVGVPSFLLKIFQRAESNNIDPRKSFSLRTISASGEFGGDKLRKILQDQYGLVSYDSYGTADLGLVAYECHEKNAMHIHEEVFVEIVDPQTGKRLGPDEVGQVVVTPFDRTYPVLRFGTGDLSAYRDESCPCGRTSNRLTKIVGRIGDAIRIRAMFLHPNQVAQVLAMFPAVSRYQVIVSRSDVRDELILKAELQNAESLGPEIKTRLKEAFRSTCRLNLDQIEVVPYGSIAKEAKIIEDRRKLNS
jgi:phenylacetate-CoA ligase